jgi:hypothetical protein
LGRRGVCLTRGAVTSIDGSAVVPAPAGAAVCDSAGPPRLPSSSEAAPDAINTDLVDTDIVPIPESSGRIRR